MAGKCCENRWGILLGRGGGSGNVRGMRWLNAIERRLEWLAFPGLFKYLTMLGVVVFAWQWIDPGAAEAIAFDRSKILEGEVWRVFSFIFAPAGVHRFTAIGALFLFFAVMIAFLISDSLESVWGPTRLTLYIVVAWLGLVVGQFIMDPPPMPTGSYLYSSLFFAFATYFPKYEFRLFMVLPVQVRWLGWLGFAMLVLSTLGNPIMLCILVPVMLPYALWVLPSHVQEKKSLAGAIKRRQKFVLSQEPAGDAFHHCEVCHRTEKDDEDLEFRVMADGTEYCLEHLPETEG